MTNEVSRVVVDANVQLGLSTSGKKALVLDGYKSVSDSVDKGEADGGKQYNRLSIVGSDVDKVYNAMVGDDHGWDSALQGGASSVKQRVAFETTSHELKDGSSSLEWTPESIKSLDDYDFKLEDSMVELKKHTEEYVSSRKVDKPVSKTKDIDLELG